MSKKKRKPRRHSKKHEKRSHRRRSHKGLPSWAVFGLELLGGALVGSVLGPAFPSVVSGEAVVVGGLAVADKHRRALLGVSAVALEGLMLATRSKPVQEATAKVARLSGEVKARVASASGSPGAIRLDERTAGNVVKNIAGAAKFAAVVP